MMSKILPAVRDMLTAALVPADVDQVYYGGDEVPEVIYRTSQTYITLEDGGETDLPTDIANVENTIFLVKLELAVRMHTGRLSLPHILAIWNKLKDVIFLPENRVLPVHGERLVDDVNFFDVDAGYIIAPNNPTWRYRSCIIPYPKITECRRTFP